MKSILLTILITLGISFEFKGTNRIEAQENLSGNKLLENYLFKKKIDNYILDSEDIIEVVINRNIPELTSIKKIDGNGTINLPKLRSVNVKGLTIEELIFLLNKEYSKFLINPDVEIVILKHRPVEVIIEGEVTNPGRYLLEGSNNNTYIQESNLEENKVLDFEKQTPQKEIIGSFPTLFDAIRRSGGVTIFSDIDEIIITRKNPLSKGGGKIQAKVSLIDFINAGDTSQNIRILDGDFIQVNKSNVPTISQLNNAIKSNLNPRFINIFITGKVESPGVYKVSRSSALNHAIAIAGGRKVIRGKTKLIRYNPDGTVITKNIKYSYRNKMGSKNNPILRSGDIIYVEKNLLNKTNEVISDVTTPFLGVFSFLNLTKDL